MSNCESCNHVVLFYTCLAQVLKHYECWHLDVDVNRLLARPYINNLCVNGGNEELYERWTMNTHDKGKNQAQANRNDQPVPLIHVPDQIWPGAQVAIDNKESPRLPLTWTIKEIGSMALREGPLIAELSSCWASTAGLPGLWPSNGG